MGDIVHEDTYHNHPPPALHRTADGTFIKFN